MRLSVSASNQIWKLSDMSDMLPIVTMLYRVTPATYTARIMSQWMSRWGWVFIIPFGVCGCMAFYRWEWIVVALALALIVYPFVVMMVYFNFGLSDTGRRAIMPRRITFDEESITVGLYKEIPNDDGTDSSYVIIDSYNIDYRNIKSAEYHEDKGFILYLRSPRYEHVFIPETSVGPNKSDIDGVLRKNGIPFV